MISSSFSCMSFRLLIGQCVHIFPTEVFVSTSTLNDFNIMSILAFQSLFKSANESKHSPSVHLVSWGNYSVLYVP